MNNEQAQALIDAARNTAKEIGAPMSIAVVDAGGYLVAFERMDGCSFLSCEIAIGKAWTAAAVGLTTAMFSQIAGGDTAFLVGGAVVNHGRLLAVPGGAPIRSGEAVVGAIGISGGTAEQDQQIADAAVAGA
jgi:uncharacterized protein GlcG (DUF336 family)